MKCLTRRFPALVVLTCVAAGLSGPRAAHADPAVLEIGRDPGLGFNLIAWWSGTTPAHWESAVQGMYDAGFREVSISPVRFTNILTGDIVLGPGQSPPIASIEAGIVRAKSLGMRVTLNPFWENYDPSETAGEQYFADVNPGPDGGCTWRGCYNPTGAVATNFWTNYQAYLTEMATLAELHGVDALTVGTEYNAIDQDPTHNANWNTVINAVDAIYHGQLGYAANHDHFNHDNVRDAIWQHPAIDFVGIDAYFTDVVQDYVNSVGATNTQRNTATDNNTGLPQVPGQTFLDMMTAAWTLKLENEILPYAAAQKGGAGMPVVFTEIGYLPYNRTSRNPQNSGSQPVDTAEQIMAFQGLIQALDGRLDEFQAMHIWQWHMTGSDGSLWNIDPTLPANQPNNVPLGQWLSNFAQAAVFVPEPSSAALLALAALCFSTRRRVRR